MIEFLDAEGCRWRADIVSHGRTSNYLNPRVHRPIVQFACLDRTVPRRYTGYPTDWGPLEDQTEEELRELLGKSSSH